MKKPPVQSQQPSITMNSTNERESFSERLQQALKNAHYSPDSPTRLAREFNIRFEGRPITVHAARKWLVGEAIPTQEKLRMIAQWLGVPADWLRFGGAEQAASLDAANREVVLSLIEEAKARGAAILGIFHDEAARERVCDRLVDVTRFTPGLAA